MEYCALNGGELKGSLETSSEYADAVAQMAAEGFSIGKALLLQKRTLELICGVLAGRRAMADVRAHYQWGVPIGGALVGKITTRLS